MKKPFSESADPFSMMLMSGLASKDWPKVQRAIIKITQDYTESNNAQLPLLIDYRSFSPEQKQILSAIIFLFQRENYFYHKVPDGVV